MHCKLKNAHKSGHAAETRRLSLLINGTASQALCFAFSPWPFFPEWSHTIRSIDGQACQTQDVPRWLAGRKTQSQMKINVRNQLRPANGLRPVSMSQTIDLTKHLNSVARAAGLVGPNGASIARQLQGIFSKIKADEVHLPFGLCHGDLELTNLMRDGDTAFLIDRERAGEGFIAREVGKLFHQLSELDQPMSDHIHAWQTACGGQWLDWHRQIVLGGMANVSRRLDDFDRIEDSQPEQKKCALKSFRLSTNRLLSDMNAQT